MYISTANYLNLHKTFLCFEKNGQTGKIGSKTDRADNRAAILNRSCNLSILLSSTERLIQLEKASLRKTLFNDLFRLNMIL